MSYVLKLLKQAAGNPAIPEEAQGSIPGAPTTPPSAAFAGGPPPEGGEDPAAAAGGGEGDPDIQVIHSAGGSALVLAPDQIKQLHDMLLSGGGEGGEPHGLMIILPHEGTDRAVHFNPIPSSALADPAQAEDLLAQWEQAHGGGDEAGADPGMGEEAPPEAQAEAGGPPMGDGQAQGQPADPNSPVAQGLRSLAGGGAPDANPGVPKGPMTQRGPMPPKMAGFLAAMLADRPGPFEKTAQQINGQGKGIAAAIDFLLKNGGMPTYTLDEMMDTMLASGKMDNPQAARAIRGQK